jgi:membrane-associated protease RseP (regulator of RpoE activity)
MSHAAGTTSGSCALSWLHRAGRKIPIEVLLLGVSAVLTGCAAPAPISPTVAATGEITSAADPLTPVGIDEVDFLKPTVKWVLPFSPAGAAGMQVGDLVTAINGHPTPTLGSAFDGQHGLAPLTSVDITVLRQSLALALTLKKAPGVAALGYSLFPWDAVYVLKDYPGLPKAIHFLNVEGFVATAYAASIRGLADIVLVRFGIENDGRDVLEAPQGIGLVDRNGDQARQLSPAEVVNATMPALGTPSQFVSPPPGSSPVYVVPPGSNYAYPVQNQWTALAQLVTAIGNIAIETHNRQIQQRERERQRLYAKLNAQALRGAALPPNSRMAGDAFFKVPKSRRPFRSMIKIRGKWYTFAFE